MTHPASGTTIAAGVLLAALAGCGGAGDAAAPPAAAPALAAEASALFDAQGRARPSPQALLPADAAARTRAGLYATRAQLEWEQLVAAPFTVVLDVDALGSVGAAVQLAEQVRHWRDLRGLAFFVQARHSADAAAVANALSDAGFGPVFVVV